MQSKADGAQAPGLVTPEQTEVDEKNTAFVHLVACAEVFRPHLPTPERIAALHAIRDRHLGDSCATQRARLLDALQTLGYVTTFEAMRYLDIFDPRPRKLELVREGHKIITTRRSEETESGQRHSIGVYSLVRGQP